jgi:putative ABC transport system ATP-binding protein
VLDLFDDLRAQGLTILVITHDGDVARRAQRRVRMVDGQLTEVA